MGWSAACSTDTQTAADSLPKKRFLLRLCRGASSSASTGKIDPYSVDDYLAHADTRLAGAQVRRPARGHREIEKSACARRAASHRAEVAFMPPNPGDKHYVICNADEGDPGAFMDRRCWKATLTLCRSMIIAAYAIGADSGQWTLRLRAA